MAKKQDKEEDVDAEEETKTAQQKGKKAKKSGKLYGDPMVVIKMD